LQWAKAQFRDLAGDCRPGPSGGEWPVEGRIELRRLNMKIIAAAAFSICSALSIGAVQAQGMMASPGQNPGQNPGQHPGQHVCLQSTAIENTTTVDASTILFHMRNGTVWKNTLKVPCPGLKFHGFSYLTRADEVCSDAQAISVIETGEACELGTFTPYAGPEQHASIQ
jgi:hypothetical protein